MGISVSVIVPAYNSEKFIVECLQSIRSQNFDSIEILVSDDNSSDNTAFEIKKFEHYDNVIAFYQAKNLGITKNCNFLLERCKGKYICFFAGDDVMLQDKLRKQFFFMEEHSDYSFCYHNAEILHSNSGHPEFQTKFKPKRVLNNAETLIKEMGVPASMSMMVRASKLPKTLFNNDYKYVSDWLMQIELALNGEVGFIDEYLCKYRKYGENNGKDISVYESEFTGLLDYVETKYPLLASACKEGKARYLLGRSFRVTDASRRREILKMSFKLHSTPVSVLLLITSYIPLTNRLFTFAYAHRMFLKKIL